MTGDAAPNSAEPGRGGLALPEGARSTSSLTNPDGPMSIADAKLLRRAARWDVPAKTKRKVVELADRTLDIPLEPNHVAALGNMLVSMDKADTARDEFEDKRDRLDSGGPTEQVNFKVTFGNHQHRTSRALPEAEAGDLG